MSWPHNDPNALARAILAQRRFHTADASPGDRPWYAPILDAIARWWHDLTAALARAAGNEAVAQIVGIVVLLAALGAAVWLGFRLLRAIRVTRRSAAARAFATDALAPDADARALLAAARAAEAAANYREAAALFWLAALRTVDERGRLAFDPARTPGEWRRALRSSAFDAFARDAVAAFFGTVPPDAALVARMRERYDAAAGA